VVTYEVRHISLAPEGLERLRGFALDSPVPGARGNLYVLQLIGWIVGLDQPVSTIEILYHDRVVKTTPIRGTRPDVVQTLGDIPPDTPCSFNCLIGLLGLKPEAELELRAVLADGTRVAVATIGIGRGALRTDFEPTLRPLMLTCLGRTGSTWVMKLLTAHPQILVYRRFPYESAPAKYWLHMLKVLSDPGNLVESAYPDTFHNDLWWVGQNPYHDESVYERPSLAYWIGRAYVERLASFCMRSIEDWYMTLAQTQEQNAPVYFAEKHMGPNYLPVLTWELYPNAKEIFLVRDFRDVACSILAFDRKRGFPGFGRPEGATDEEYLRGPLQTMALHLGKSWESRSEQGHLLRYEDLVYKPRETLTALLEYLELDASEATVEHMLAVGEQSAAVLPGTSIAPEEFVNGHRTTEDLKSSIGRWKQERDADFRALCNEVFSEALGVFGYAESGYVPG
jgi:hypothetical protein